MELKIDGNPGTGNSFTQVVIQAGGVYNNNPNATAVTNTSIIYGDGKEQPGRVCMDDREKQILKTAILEFVGKLKPKVSTNWANRYDTLWVSILAIPEVDAVVYDKGQQKNTLFNRSFVGSIVKVLLDNKVFEQTASPTVLAPLIGEDGSESFRKEMGRYPSDEIREAIIGLVKK